MMFQHMVQQPSGMCSSPFLKQQDDGNNNGAGHSGLEEELHWGYWRWEDVSEREVNAKEKGALGLRSLSTPLEFHVTLKWQHCQEASNEILGEMGYMSSSLSKHLFFV